MGSRFGLFDCLASGRRLAKRSIRHRPLFEQLGSTSSDLVTRRPDSFRPSLENLEERRLLSFASGAISDASGGYLYALTKDNSGPNSDVWVHNGQGWAQLSGGGVVQQISAGADISGKPMVYALTNSGNIFEHHTASGGGWAQLSSGGLFTAISGGIGDTVYAIDSTRDVWSFNLSGPHQLTNCSCVDQISDGFGNNARNNFLFVVSGGNVWENIHSDNASPLWIQLSTSTTVIGVRGGATDSVFAITNDGNVWYNSVNGGWEEVYSLGNADNVATFINPLLATLDEVLITDSNQDLFFSGPGDDPANPTRLLGNLHLAGDIAGGVDTVDVLTTAESQSVLPTEDLWQKAFLKDWTQLSSNSVVTDEDDSQVF